LRYPRCPDSRQEADINAPDLGALFKPLDAQQLLALIRDGSQHSLPCSRTSKQSMDENNCRAAFRIFIEKNGKYIFLLTGARMRCHHCCISLTLSATGTLLKTA
jgi:hypothetical protein